MIKSFTKLAKCKYNDHNVNYIKMTFNLIYEAYWSENKAIESYEGLDTNASCRIDP